MQKKILGALAAIMLVSGCAQKPKDPAQTQLQLRAFQTRTFETADKAEVLTAVMEALQDEGFIIKNVVPDVGLISATREADVEDFGEKFFSIFFQGEHALWNKNALLEANANVKTQRNKTRVRLTFQEKVMNNRGGVEDVKFLDNPVFYQNVFDKVQKSIFIESHKL